MRRKKSRGFLKKIAQKIYPKFVQFAQGKIVVSGSVFWYTVIKKRERGARQ